MNEDQSRDEFGCLCCWPPSAEAAERARLTLTTQVELIDESHFHVTIRACPRCSQRFVSIFTETIDWADGDDPQYISMLPITPDEAAGLIRQNGDLTETMLNALGPHRRSLHYD